MKKIIAILLLSSTIPAYAGIANLQQCQQTGSGFIGVYNYKGMSVTLTFSRSSNYWCPSYVEL